MGVFYSPISDATTYDIVACRFDQTQGYFRCDQGRLLWNLRGRAYFGRVHCNGVPCDQKVYYLGDKINLNPFEVYVQGQKQCLYMQVENKAGQKLLGQNQQGLFVDLEPDQSDPTRTVLKPELNDQLLLPEITNDNFRREPPRIEIDGVKFQQLDVIGDVTGRRTFIDFVDTTDDGKPEEYRVENGVFTEYKDNHEEFIFGFKVLFKEVTVPKDASGSRKCQDIEEGQRCVRYPVTIVEPAIKSATEQEWTINLELRHAPGNRSQGSCSESRREDLIVYQGTPQRKQIKVRVRPSTAAESKACLYQGGTTPNSNLCDCNGDGDTEDDEDCDGIEKRYCRVVSANDKKCRKYPLCNPPNTINTGECDCGWNGQSGDADGNSCKGKYCHTDNKCYPAPVESAALPTTPTIDQTRQIAAAAKNAPSDTQYIGVDPDGIIGYFKAEGSLLFVAVPSDSRWVEAKYDGKPVQFRIQGEKLTIYSEKHEKWYEIGKFEAPITQTNFGDSLKLFQESDDEDETIIITGTKKSISGGVEYSFNIPKEYSSMAFSVKVPKAEKQKYRFELSGGQGLSDFDIEYGGMSQFEFLDDVEIFFFKLADDGNKDYKATLKVIHKQSNQAVEEIRINMKSQ